MTTEIDIQALATSLKRQRGKKGLRIAAQEIGDVSAATLSRVEQGKVPDLDTFIKLCRWLNMSPDEFIVGYNRDDEQIDSSARASQSATTPEIIAAHLRTDRTLDPDTAEALIKMIELAYQAALRGDIKQPE